MESMTLEEQVRLEQSIRDERIRNHDITLRIMDKLGYGFTESGHQAETGSHKLKYLAADPEKITLFAVINGAVMGYKKEGEDYFLRNKSIPEEIKEAVRQYSGI